MNGGGSPSSEGFWRREPWWKPGVGGYEISVLDRDAWGEVTGLPSRRTQVQPLKCRRSGWVLVVFSKEEETAGGAAELKPTDLGIDPSTCQELDKCRQAVLRCTA